MTAEDRVAGGRSAPGLRYRDVAAAIDWLTRAFGFEVRTVERSDHGDVVYAELTFGSTIIMVGAVSGFDIDSFMAQPDDVGGAETQCCYYVVDDFDTLYQRARRAGCDIVIDRQTRPNGSLVFTCRDPEGHLWCFGTYDPWKRAPVNGAPAAKPAPEPKPAPTMDLDALAASAFQVAPLPVSQISGRLAAGLSMGAIITAIAVAWVFYGEAWRTSREATAAPAALIVPERMVGAQIASEEFQRAIKDVRVRLAVERRSRIIAEREAREAHALAAQERDLRMTAEQAARDLTTRLDTAQKAADAAEDAAKAAQQNLDKNRTAKSAEAVRLEKELETAKRTASTESQRLSGELAAAKRAASEETKRLTTELAAAQKAAAKAREELVVAQRARVAAEKEAQETRARLTFVSLNTEQGSEDVMSELRKQMSKEKSAREAAERETREVRNELAHERSLKTAAWRTVTQLKKRLASIGVSTKSASVPAPRPAKRRPKVAAQPRPQTAEAAPPKMANETWNLYRGPHFVKDP
jgi:uncharacterized glyoxalase superfamily protein PhnB